MIDAIFRSFPTFKGKMRLASFLMRSAIKNASDITIQGSLGIRYYLPNLADAVGLEIFVNGIYERNHIQFIAQQVPVGGCLLDLGANVGAIAIPVAKLRPDIRIVAVEASTRIVSYLKRNVEINACNNIHIINAVLSDVDNELIPFFSALESFGKGSMTPLFTSEPEYIKSIKLDTLVSELNLGKVDFIKIDVEGYEKLVFSGGTKVLSSDPAPKILFEFVDWAEHHAHQICGDAQRYLLKLGYKLDRFTGDKVCPIKSEISVGSAMVLATKV